MKRIFIVAVCILCVFSGCKKAPAATPTNEPTQAPATPLPTGIETEEDDFTSPDNNGSETPGNGNSGTATPDNGNSGTATPGNGNSGSETPDRNNGGETTFSPEPDTPSPIPTDDGIIRLPEISW